jgi:hypothetical protein
MHTTNSIAVHPINQFLADHSDQWAQDIDLSRLDEVIFQEEESHLIKQGLSAVRVTRVGQGLPEIREVKGTLTSRLNCLLDETTGCITQAEWREKAKVHPAYELIYAELREAFDTQELTQKFDVMEKFGVEVYYDRGTKLLTLGLNASKIRKGFSEVISMKDIRNKRALDIINNVGFGLLKEDDNKPESVAPQAATFYITFQLGDTPS